MTQTREALKNFTAALLIVLIFLYGFVMMLNGLMHFVGGPAISIDQRGSLDCKQEAAE